ncbi:MAG: zinc-dependent metalloprotease [Gemmatimonadales bacterium]|nr:zinc-dependent metalloprotease [Gemmatimonadales bacterium]
MSLRSWLGRGLPIAALLVVGPGPLAAQLPTIAEKTRGLERIDGFVPLYWDAATGKLWLEISRLGEEILYVSSLPAGVGSNDIGLDRGQLGGERVVRFDRIGPKLLMVQPNYGYRAITDNPDERRAVEQAFAQSVLWGFKVEAESNGAVLVDGTDFVLRDAHDVVGTMRRTGQGTFRLDGSRSALYLPRTKGFPRNSEIEATLTFLTDNPGRWVRDVAPTPEAVTVRQHHSFVALPEPGYRPRESDPRAGYFGISYYDYATPIHQPIEKRFISRHRLQKKDPAAAMSDPVTPIVYYLDRGTPEPIRSALLDGARWWNQAFEAAGYRNAFRVEMMPEGADPMDVRYNVIQWIHRSTRGWSYGATVTDPRTGEIIKGHVSLGSLRVRQDLLLAQGLIAPYVRGDERPTRAEEMALARIRQLSAHEVGHTLGIQHNYISSAQRRASVMDYPHPVVKLAADGSIDLTDAYTNEIGEWDKEAVKYGYQDFPTGTDEKAALERLIESARARGLTFLTDQDARPAGSAHPTTHLWDNGADAAAELDRMMKVRQAALARFGDAAIPAGAPMATLEEVLVPLYLHHRYQVEAAAKVIGGQWYDYAMRGDGTDPIRAVPAAQQLAALGAILATLDPAALALPRGILARIPPRPVTYGPHRELFDRSTGLVFDAISPAAAAADISTQFLLNPERAARLVQQRALDPAQPGLDQVIDRLVAFVFDRPAADGYRAEIGRAVQRVVVDRMMSLAASASMPQVRAIATEKLRALAARPLPSGAGSADNRAARALIAADIRRFMERPYDPTKVSRAPDAPPGSPIGVPPMGDDHP